MCLDASAISLWDTAPESEVGTALAALSMEGTPLYAVVTAAGGGGGGGGARDLLCLDDTGAAKIWELSEPVQAAKARDAPVCAVRVKQAAADPKHAAAQPDQIFAVALTSAGRLALAHGSELKPALQVSPYRDDDASSSSSSGSALVDSVEVAAVHSGSVLISSSDDHAAAAAVASATQGAGGGAVSVIGAVDMPVPMRLASVGPPAAGSDGIAATTVDGAAADGGDGPSLGERAQKMMAEEADSAATERQDSSRHAMAATAAAGGAPTAGSLASLLVQALQSDDSALLGECLNGIDTVTMQHTVARLPSSVVHKLLTTLVAKFQSRPHKSHVLVAWIREILLAHASVRWPLPLRPPRPVSLTGVSRCDVCSGYEVEEESLRDGPST